MACGGGKKQTTACTQMLPKFYFSIYYTVKLCNLAGYIKSLDYTVKSILQGT